MRDMASPPPSSWRRAFLLQLVVTGLATTAMQATRPTMTYRALSLGASPLEIGLIQSAFSIVPALTAVAIGRWIDRVGESRYLMLSLRTLAVGSLVAFFAPGLLILGLAQVVLGLGQIIYLLASQSLVANHGPRESREARYGHYFTVTSLGQLAGPAIAAAIVAGSIGLVAIGESGLLASTNALDAPQAVGSADLRPDNPEAGVFLFACVVTLVASGLAFLIPGYARQPLDDASAAVGGRPPGILAVAGQVLRRSGMVSAMLVSMTVISSIDVLIAYMPAAARSQIG